MSLTQTKIYLFLSQKKLTAIFLFFLGGVADVAEFRKIIGFSRHLMDCEVTTGKASLPWQAAICIY